MTEPPGTYIVDTNIISNRGAAEADRTLVDWLRLNAPLLRISVVTIAEMHRGLILLGRKVERITDAKVKRREQPRLQYKRAWLEEVTRGFADRIIPIDLAVAERWAEVSVRFPSLRDGDKAIAATALAKRCGVATQNLGDFRRAGVPLINPFDRTTWNQRGGST